MGQMKRKDSFFDVELKLEGVGLVPVDNIPESKFGFDVETTARVEYIIYNNIK